MLTLCGRQKGHWTSVGEAGEAMRKYMLQKLLESRPDIIANGSSVDDAAEILWAEASKKGCLQLPTQAALRADGRKDLRYVLQVPFPHNPGRASSFLTRWLLSSYAVS